MDNKIAGDYSMSCEQAAEGVITVVNSNIVRFLREAVIGRGYDPRAFSLLAYGGAGPLTPANLAAALEMKQVLVPAHPGTFSAFGILTADARYDVDRMVMGLERRAQTTSKECSRSSRSSREQLETERLLPRWSIASIRPSCATWDRTTRSRSSCPVPVTGSRPGQQGRQLDRIGAEPLFHEKHRRLYGFQRDDHPGQFVRLHVSVIGRTPALAEERPGWLTAPATTPPMPHASRSIYARSLNRRVDLRPRDEVGRRARRPVGDRGGGIHDHVPQGGDLPSSRTTPCSSFRRSASTPRTRNLDLMERAVDKTALKDVDPITREVIQNEWPTSSGREQPLVCSARPSRRSSTGQGLQQRPAAPDASVIAQAEGLRSSSVHHQTLPPVLDARARRHQPRGHLHLQRPSQRKRHPQERRQLAAPCSGRTSRSPSR